MHIIMLNTKYNINSTNIWAIVKDEERMKRSEYIC